MPTIPSGWLSRAITTKTGIKWWTRIEGFREKCSPDSTQTTLLALVKYNDTSQFKRDMIGYSALVGSQLTRSLPQHNPYEIYQYCTSCDLVNAEGNPTNVPSFEHWIGFDWYTYQLTFTSPLNEYFLDNQIGGETIDGVYYRKEWLRNTILRPRLEGRNQLIPGNSFETNDTPAKPIGQVTTLLTTENIYEMQWLEVPMNDKLKSNIRSTLGKINKTDLNFESNDTWKAGTVLFEKVEATPRRSILGDITWDLKYLFRRKGKGIGDGGTEIDVTWNMLPRANRRYTLVHVKNDISSSIYQVAEFRKLFSFS